ncbi:MAG: EAL domain-containing protein [Pseudomonadota bacterium]|nr:EAL domain-containing protein [Pseudomonadota bacterium]
MDQGKHRNVSDSPLVDFDALCHKIRAAIEPARVHAVSLHDETGDVLWLTESSMGPDEHNAVSEGFETFSNANTAPVVVYDLGDSRSAVLFRIVGVRRAIVGAVMVIMDSRGINHGDKGALTLMTPTLQRALMEFAGMRSETAPRPAEARPPSGALRAPAATRIPAPIRAPLPKPSARSPPSQTAPGLASAGASELTLADSMRIPKPPAAPPAAPSVSPAPAAAPPTTKPAAVPVPADIDRLNAALRRSPIALHVQRLVPLNKGSQLQRYEVLLRSKSSDAPNAAPQAMLKTAVDNGLGSMIDRRVVTELIGWLVHHPDVWQAEAAMFSVNLTSTALQDEHFVKFVDLCLAKSSLPKAMIGFEIDVATAVGLGDKATEITTALHRLGCPVVLDDFGLRTECFNLLRLPAVRYVKLASAITAKMRSDKLSQAAITGVVQMARVLGMHTVAKRTETAAEQEWLTALGVDFIQSNALSPPASIDSLSKQQRSKK